MNARGGDFLASLCALVTTATFALPAGAQVAEAKEKAPMYTYVSNWVIPRPRWADMEKAGAANDKIFEKALASGMLIGYGRDTNLVHQADDNTHDTWWSSMSMAGLLNTLDEIYKSGSATSPILGSAAKHWDSVFVSRFYNWKAGPCHGCYTHESSYKLKVDAPDDAVATLSKNLIVPLLEKLVADGTLNEYEIDVQAVHTDSPGTFWIIYIPAQAEGIDKVNAALQEAMKANPLGGPAFAFMIDFAPHRDSLARSDAIYK